MRDEKNIRNKKYGHGWFAFLVSLFLGLYNWLFLFLRSYLSRFLSPSPSCSFATITCSFASLVLSSSSCLLYPHRFLFRSPSLLFNTWSFIWSISILIFTDSPLSFPLSVSLSLFLSLSLSVALFRSLSLSLSFSLTLTYLNGAYFYISVLQYIRFVFHIQVNSSFIDHVFQISTVISKEDKRFILMLFYIWEIIWIK